MSILSLEVVVLPELIIRLRSLLLNFFSQLPVRLKQLINHVHRLNKFFTHRIWTQNWQRVKLPDMRLLLACSWIMLSLNSTGQDLLIRVIFRLRRPTSHHFLRSCFLGWLGWFSWLGRCVLWHIGEGFRLGTNFGFLHLLGCWLGYWLAGNCTQHLDMAVCLH